MDKKIFKQIKKTINKAKSIALFCHVDPDFDCLCSMFSLNLGLKQLGKQTQMFSHEKFAPYQASMLDESLVKVGDFNSKDFDLLISVDTSTQDRLGIYSEEFEKFDNTIKIDHHQKGEPYGRISFVDETSSSCCEIIYELLSFLKVNITPEMAGIIYCGLSSDTNSFTNSNTNYHSLWTAMELYKKGADICRASDANTKMNSLATYSLKKTLYKNAEIIDNQIAISTIDFQDFKRANGSKQDCGGFSSELLSYIGVNISCCMTQVEDNVFSCSIRSMIGYDVSKIANAFGGGGHVCASGCKIKAKTIEDAKNKFIKATKTYLKQREKNNA